MSDVDLAEGELDAPKKNSKLPLLIGIVLSLVLGGGGFFAVYSGMLLAPAPTTEMAEKEMEEEFEPLPDVSFIELQPLVINLGAASANRHLKFAAQLEIEPDAKRDVESVLPRITDVLNGYLRAVSVDELEEPTALVRLRTQMLRRVQIVVGEGRVRDLLIMEFVLN